MSKGGLTSRVFGPFVLSNRSLFRDGKPVVIGGRAFAILSALIAEPGALIGKKALMATVWPDATVADANLVVQLSTLRRILGRAGDGQHYIKTEAGRGYRFVAPVEVRSEIDWSEEAATVAAWPSHNLPRALTRLIGRGHEEIELVGRLQESRIVTITGFGGIGKTRVALAVSERSLAHFPGGVWFVELATETDPAAVPTRLAAALQIDGGEQALADLIKRIAERRLLLVLDNCEHLIAAVAGAAAQLLGACPNLAILATSREPLAIDGEIVRMLPPLTVPTTDQELTIEGMSNFSSVELLVERAAAKGFSWTTENIPELAEICRQLDGIPLAIELAAARLPALGVTGLFRMLGQRFSILTHGQRTALPRHRTLRAMMDWSHDLLSGVEQIVLRQLSIFAGGWSLDAAENIIANETVAEHMANLVDKSLVLAWPTPHGIRYAMLETVRVYAAEKLLAAGETQPFAQAHAAYFRDLFRDNDDRPFQRNADEWLRQHAPEIDNVRAALDWAFGPDGDPVVGIVLAGCTPRLWSWVGSRREGGASLRRAVGHLDASIQDVDRARLNATAAKLLKYDEPDRARAMIASAIELYRALGDDRRRGDALLTQADLQRLGGDDEAAEATWREVGGLLTDEEPFLQALLLSGLGGPMGAKGNVTEAIALVKQAITLFRLAGSKTGEAHGLSNLSDMLQRDGRVDEAIVTARSAVEILRRLGGREILGHALGNLAACLLERGELAAADEAGREALSALRHSEAFQWVLDYLALIHFLDGAEEPAARLVGYANKVYAALGRSRGTNEQRVYDRLMTGLALRLTPTVLLAHLAEGTVWSEDQAITAALSRSPGGGV